MCFLLVKNMLINEMFTRKIRDFYCGLDLQSMVLWLTSLSPLLVRRNSAKISSFTVVPKLMI